MEREREKIMLTERLARGLWVARRVMAVNLICLPVFLPVFSWFYLVVNSYVYAVGSGGMVDVLPGLGYFAGLLLLLPPVIFYALFALSAVLSGPFFLGLHYVLGGIVTGRHVWVSDVFRGMRDNFRQGVVLGIFSVVAVHLLLWSIFGGLALATDESWLAIWLMVSRWVSVVLLAALLMTLPFVCQIAVTVKQPLRAIVKNGVILARVYVGRGFLVLLCTALYWLGTTVLVPSFSLVTLPLFSVALTVLWQAIICGPVVRRHVIEPMK